jgi:methionine aminotransferase
VTRYPGLRERSFVISSFGKTYHVTGWKVAYCLAPRALTTEFRKAHQFIVFTVHHPSQLALADFMRAKPGVRRQLAAFYQAKRDFFRKQLEGSKLRAAALRRHLLPARHLRRDQRRAGYQLRPAPDQGAFGVAAIPVSVFNPDGEDRRVIRFCFAKTESDLAAAGERLRKILAPVCRGEPIAVPATSEHRICFLQVSDRAVGRATYNDGKDQASRAVQYPQGGYRPAPPERT